MPYGLRERFESFEESIRTVIDGYRKATWHSMPVTVASDSDGKTASLQANIKGQVKQFDGTMKLVDIALMNDVPISFVGGGGVTSTHPVKKGDEGEATLHSRPLDTWFQSGGQQAPVDQRTHSLSDAVYQPAVRSTPRALKWINTSAHHIRSDDAKHTLEMHPLNGHHHKSVDKGDSTGGSDDPNDAGGGPFNKAKKFYEGLIQAATGIFHNATDSGTTHTASLTHTDGHTHHVNNGQHKITVHPSSGIQHNVNTGDHTITLDTTNGITAKTIQNFARQATKAITDTAASIGHSGPTTITGTLGISQLASFAGGLSTGALEVAPDSAGGSIRITLLGNYANDAAAATGGVPVNGIYQSAGVLRIRIS